MIFTFYSYKGGVGRSMALANLGECFFQRGLKVVMIDWDLEAPGLESYFFSDPGRLSLVAARRGLIDMLGEYKEKYPQFAQSRMYRGASGEPAQQKTIDGHDEETVDAANVAEIERETAEVAEITRRFLEKHSRRVPERLRAPLQAAPVASSDLTFDQLLDQGLTPVGQYLEAIEKSHEAGLWLLTAGARSSAEFGEYADAVQEFDWLEFLAKYQGKEYLEWLRDKLAWADVVLIDSRTGVTEMSGVCTRQMGDAVISFCAPNSQNLDGVARIVSSLGSEAAKLARFQRDLQVLVIPTRIDDSESSLAGKFALEFDQRLEIQNLPPDLTPNQLEGLQRPLWNLYVPYIPKFNYREQLVIGPRAGVDGSLATESAKTADGIRQPPPDPPTQKLIRAYENIAVHLAVLAKPGSRMRQAYASEIATQFPQLELRKPPRMAPQLPGNWVERPSLTTPLQEALMMGAKTSSGGRVAVCGLTGTGKTSLVAHLCETPEIIAAFPDGIVWLTLEGPLGKERMQDFLRTSFGIPRQGGDAALELALEEKQFLWVLDDVWTPEQLTEFFRWGKRCTRVIVTRDRAIAGRFDTVVNTGCLTRAESCEFLRITAPLPEAFEKDAGLAWLLEWPLGAALLAAALDRYTAEAGSPEQAWELLLERLKKSGLKVLDRPGTSGRNGSVSLSLRESLGRLLPRERRLLMEIARGNVSEPGADSPEVRRLIDLGLISRGTGSEPWKPHEVVYRWLLGQGDLTEDAEVRRKRERTEALKKGYDIVRGIAASLEEKQRAAELAKDVRAFSLARKLFELIRNSPEAATLAPGAKLKLIQRHALCTYKDDDLVADERFGDALGILNEGDLQTANPSQETLGQAGAIYKTKWRLGGQRRDLERALHYYKRGTESVLEGDFGYTRINAAFVLDLLAKQEEADSPSTASPRREQAARLREEIAAELPGLAARPENGWLKEEWWYGATMAEALFGLKRYAEARHWFREAIALDPPAWQLETTTRQMAMLAFAQGVNFGENEEATQTLAMLVGDSSEALRAITAGKVGLALSGGGFRASLFHIGVLARLAELDVLRHVEVLSCVSGGSIIGAHYYLEVRRLLQEKRDREIAREDYIEIVKRLERDFLAGVQMNLRGRLFAGWLANWKTLLVGGYTRTKYLGEMLEKHIYSRVQDGEHGTRRLNSLQITPKDGGQDFNPKLDNWRRAAKAPILLLNATSLNTGHVWQFAVSWMGEPPQSARSSVDSNDLLRRMYYHEAPVAHRQVRLGHAVAASACVPALFDPIEFDGLFPQRRLRLVDGGVHDNQGTAGLLEQECSVVLVSDASGQMNSERAPSGNLLRVLMRSNSVSMARVREAQFREMETLRRSSALTGLMFLHLKKDLDIQHVNWVGCLDPYRASQSGAPLTTYGVPKNVQSLLAGLRTDLDTFSDAEAYALMLSGYRMTNTGFKSSLPQFPVVDTSRETWRFLGIEPTIDRASDFEPEHDRLCQVLTVGGGLAFKSFRLRPFASTVMAGTLAAVLVAAAAAIATLWQVTSTSSLEAAGAPARHMAQQIAGAFPDKIPDEREALRVARPHRSSSNESERLQARLGRPVWMVWIAGGILVATLVILAILQRRSISVLITGALVVTGGWLIARIHLWIFEPIFRGAGLVRLRPQRLSALDHQKRGG